jgi:DNA polymerase-3 subunit epsilon
MKFLTQGAKAAGSSVARILRKYSAFPGRAKDTPLGSERIVVADVETSGLDPYRDRLISIGAVALDHGLVDFGDSFQAVLRQERASSGENILVHGIDGSTQLAGMDASDALVAWLDFAGAAPLVGFHADFDRIVLTRAARDVLGVKPANPWLDLAFLAPALFADASASPRVSAPGNGGHTLDDWLRIFAIEANARHDALSDALATAQLFQIVSAQAARRGLHTLGALRKLERNQRRLAQSLRH